MPLHIITRPAVGGVLAFASVKPRPHHRARDIRAVPISDVETLQRVLDAAAELLGVELLGYAATELQRHAELGAGASLPRCWVQLHGGDTALIRLGVETGGVELAIMTMVMRKEEPPPGVGVGEVRR